MVLTDTDGTLLNLLQQQHTDDRANADHCRRNGQTDVQPADPLGRRHGCVRRGTRCGNARRTWSRAAGGGRRTRRCRGRRGSGGGWARWRGARRRGRSQGFGWSGCRRRSTGRGHGWRRASGNRRQLDRGRCQRFWRETDADGFLLGLNFGGVTRSRRNSARWWGCRGSAWTVRIVLSHKSVGFCSES